MLCHNEFSTDIVKLHERIVITVIDNELSFHELYHTPYTGITL